MQRSSAVGRSWVAAVCSCLATTFILRRGVVLPNTGIRYMARTLVIGAYALEIRPVVVTKSSVQVVGCRRGVRGLDAHDRLEVQEVPYIHHISAHGTRSHRSATLHLPCVAHDTMEYTGNTVERDTSVE